MHGKLKTELESLRSVLSITKGRVGTDLDAWLGMFGEASPLEMYDYIKRDLPGIPLVSFHYARPAFKQMWHDSISIEVESYERGLQENKPLWRIKGFDFNFEIQRASIGLVTVDREQQAGTGTTILRNIFELWKEFDMNAVDLEARNIVGGYAWLKFGFKPGFESMRRIPSEIIKRLDELGEQVPDETKDAIGQVLESKKGEALWYISDLELPVVSPKYGDVKLGQALMLEVCWDGQLDLKDEKSMQRFNERTKQGPQLPSPLEFVR